jgi:hypothetical protein
MEIKRIGLQPSVKGRQIDLPATSASASRFREPMPRVQEGPLLSPLSPAHAAWHTHPLGQILIVTAGAEIDIRES